MNMKLLINQHLPNVMAEHIPSTELKFVEFQTETHPFSQTARITFLHQHQMIVITEHDSVKRKMTVFETCEGQLIS